MLRFQILFSLAFLGLATAQDSAQAVTPPAEAPKLGFGVSIGPSTVLLAGPEGSYPSEQMLSALYFSITGPRFKFEPEFAISRISATTDATDYTYEQALMALRFGAGLFGVSSIDKTVLYYGARAGVIVESVSYEFRSDFAGEDESDSESRTNLYIGPAAGAEYFVAKNFSVGAEGQLIFTFYGDYSSGDETEAAETDYTEIGNRALFFLRWYY